MLLPVIGVGPVVLGDAPGAPAVATVPGGSAMVDLFNSAASQATLALKDNQDLYETYYKAILGLREAAGRPTWSHQLEITKKAVNLLSRNLAAQLNPTQADLDAYGIGTLNAGISNGNAKEQLTNIGRTLITTARAFKLGLTTSVYDRDDRHRHGRRPVHGPAQGVPEHDAAPGDRGDLRADVQRVLQRSGRLATQ